MYRDISNTDVKYSIIYADPPWCYDSRMALGKGAKRSSAQDYYSTMSLDAICDLKSSINKIADDNCVLFLWTTFPKLFDAQSVISSWGFKYKTCAFVWVKENKKFNAERAAKNEGIDDFMGQGRWTRQNAEICLLCVRGKPKRLAANVRQIVYAPIGKHSEKPNEIRNRIVQLLGDIPRIELFARQSSAGWDTWGDEAPGSSTWLDNLLGGD